MSVDDSTYESRSLIHRRGVMPFAMYVRLGAGVVEWVEFEREVIWLQDEETTWGASLSGKVMKEGGTWNSFYGPGTSDSEAIGAAAAWRTQFPMMHVEVVTRLRLFPARNSGKAAFYKRSIQYHPLPKWFVRDEALADWRKAGSPGWHGDHGVRVLEAETRSVIVWRNGERTPEGEALRAELAIHLEKLRLLPDDRSAE
jgi:hypothetical protein